MSSSANENATGESSASPFDSEATKMTCDVLCSLSVSASAPLPENGLGNEAGAKRKPAKSASRSCPKQLQLPLFLSKTYHMIDRCDCEVACWAESGENFVVKNVEKFSSDVLPRYFKHSNFSSFARQLNFYGFRKLRSEAILTSDVDPKTADHIRFFHASFQRGKPDLLHQIKRATKSDQHSKDDMDSLKQEIASLRDELAGAKNEYSRKIAELSYEFNRRITSMNAEYDKLALFVQQSLGAAAAAAAAASTSVARPAASAVGPAPHVPDLLQSLSQAAALTLQSQLRAQPPAPPATAPPPVPQVAAMTNAAVAVGNKRPNAYAEAGFSGANKKMHMTDEM